MIPVWKSTELASLTSEKSGLEPAGILPMEVPGRERVCVVYSRSSSRSTPMPPAPRETEKR